LSPKSMLLSDFECCMPFEVKLRTPPTPMSNEPTLKYSRVVLCWRADDIALAPSSPMLFPEICIVVRWVFEMRASASEMAELTSKVFNGRIVRVCSFSSFEATRAMSLEQDRASLFVPQADIWSYFYARSLALARTNCINYSIKSGRGKLH